MQETWWKTKLKEMGRVQLYGTAQSKIKQKQDFFSWKENIEGCNQFFMVPLIKLPIVPKV